MKTLTLEFNSISVKKGEEFTISLASNASTGHSWDLEVTAGKASLVREECQPVRPMLCGSGSINSWIYKAEEDADIEIKAEYRRPWEKAVAPTNSVVFKVKVG